MRTWCASTCPPASTLEADKFTALNGALWNGGAFLYVPRGVAVDLPLHSLICVDGRGRRPRSTTP